MLSKEELKKEAFLLNVKLNKAHIEFNNMLTEYIDGFDSSIDYSFTFSEKQSKKCIRNYYALSVHIASFYEITSAATAKLSEKLISAYDSNYVDLIEDIDNILKRQLLFEESISSFIKSCENELSNNKENISPKFLSKRAIELKQKLELLILK